MIKTELEKIVGEEYVFDDEETLEKYSKDQSLVQPRKPTYVIKPNDTEQVKEIVRLANKYMMPIIPISSGVHFYGATIPQQGGMVVDLSRMNKILNVDERNRAVRIQPGVTWGQLQRELEKHGLRALNPFLPHSSKSALSSNIEREPMLIPKTEYGEPILTMEIVLPNGDIFRTGSASVAPPEEAGTDLVAPYGPGLDFFRLFQGVQGTMGIVTWINIKAPPLPQLEKLFFIPSQGVEKIVEFIYSIQRRILGYECLVLNNISLASILAEKWPEDFNILRETLPNWILIQCLGGTHILPGDKIAYEKEDMMEICQQLGLDGMTTLPGLAGSAKMMLEKIRQPWKEEPYWKQRYKGGCYDLFFYTTLNRVPEFISAVYELVAKHGYSTKDIGIYIQPLDQGRACYLEYSIYYDPENSNEAERVHTFHNQASLHLINLGAFFARPYGLWSEIVYSRNTTFTSTLKTLKQIVDPNNIMNPGKLCF